MKKFDRERLKNVDAFIVVKKGTGTLGSKYAYGAIEPDMRDFWPYAFAVQVLGFVTKIKKPGMELRGVCLREIEFPDETPVAGMPVFKAHKTKEGWYEVIPQEDAWDLPEDETIYTAVKL